MAGAPVLLPTSEVSPVETLLRRLGLVLALLTFVALLAYFGRRATQTTPMGRSISSTPSTTPR